MSQASILISLAQAIGADIKALTDKIGDPSGTGWTDKTNLANQLAEVLEITTAMNQGAGLDEGQYVPDQSTNYLKNASSLANADTLLDTKLKSVSDQVAELASGGSGVQIDDTAGDGDTTVVWSADKVYDAIETAKQAVKDSLLNGAGAAYDTLKELQDLIVNDETIITTLSTAVANRVRYDDVQTLSTAQKLQACTNIGIGDPETDLVAAYNTAKA